MPLEKLFGSAHLSRLSRETFMGDLLSRLPFVVSPFSPAGFPSVTLCSATAAGERTPRCYLVTARAHCFPGMGLAKAVTPSAVTWCPGTPSFSRPPLDMGLQSRRRANICCKTVPQCNNHVNLDKGLNNFIQVLQPNILGQALLIFRRGMNYVPSHELAAKRRNFPMPGLYHFKYGAPWKSRPTQARNRELSMTG